VNNAARISHYLRDRSTLTPAQRRRVAKRAHVESSPLATVRRASRLRKAIERKRRGEVRAVSQLVVTLVRRGRGR